MINVEDAVRRVVAETLGIPESSVTDGASFVVDLGLDSLDSGSLQEAIWQEFDLKKVIGIEYYQSDLEQVNTVGELIAFVKVNLRVG